MSVLKPSSPLSMKKNILSILLLSTSLAFGETAPPDLPLPVASFGAAATPSGNVYFYGGHSGVRHKYNKEEVHGDFFHWHQGMEGWEKLAADEPAQGASLVATENGVLRIGGMAAKNSKEEKQDLWSSETAARFDLKDKKWHALPKMPERRSSHDSVLVGNTLYVIGGWALGGDTQKAMEAEWHNTYLTLDLSNPDAGWQEHPQPFERRALAVQVVGSKLYAIGGMNSDNDIINDVSILDTTTGEWSSGPSLPQNKLGGFGFAAIVHENRLFASGAAGMLLELRGNEWVNVAKLQYPRFFHRLLPGGPGKLYAIGGESGRGKKAVPETIALPAADSKPLPDEKVAAGAMNPHGGGNPHAKSSHGGKSPHGKAEPAEKK